jgi:hypothetical protein
VLVTFMKKNHYLKSWPEFFWPIKDGKKLHDLRHDDRKFKVGDICTLQEYDPRLGRYTGQTLCAEITFITGRETPCAFSSAVLHRDYVILSLKVL